MYIYVYIYTTYTYSYFTKSSYQCCNFCFSIGNFEDNRCYELDSQRCFHLK